MKNIQYYGVIALVLLVGCAQPTNKTDLTQAVADAQAIAHGADLALPAFKPFLTVAEYAQVSSDLGKADGYAATLLGVVDQTTQATNIQSVLNLVSGIVNVVSTDLPTSVPPNIQTYIAEFQAVMVLVQAVAPLVGPLVGQKAGAKIVPAVFYSTMSVDNARVVLKK